MVERTRQPHALQNIIPTHMFNFFLPEQHLIGIFISLTHDLNDRVTYSNLEFIPEPAVHCYLHHDRRDVRQLKEESSAANLFLKLNIMFSNNY